MFLVRVRVGIVGSRLDARRGVGRGRGRDRDRGRGN